MALFLVPGDVRAVLEPPAPDPESIPVRFIRDESVKQSREPPVDPAGADVIVVVGSRHPQITSALNQSVAVVDGQTLERQGASSLAEALNAIPGVAIEGGPRPNAAFVNIRGLSGPRVLLIVDGARQNFLGGHRSSLLVEPELLKQIELLRGPASAIWGSDALGGVVVLSTKDAEDLLAPGERLGGRLRTGFESNTGERLGSAIGAVKLGGFDGVVSAVSRRAEDFRRADGEREPHTDQATQGTLVKLGFRPEGSAHRLGLTHQGFEQSGLSPSNPATRVTDTNPLLDRSNDVAYTVARYGYAPESGRLRGLQLDLYRDTLRIREDRVEQPRADRTRFATRGMSGHATLAMTASPSAPLLTVGGDAFEDASRATRNGTPRPQFPDAERRVAGVFSQLEWPLGALSLTPGLRYDRYRASTNQTDDPPMDESAVSPKLGFVWRLSDGLRLRGGYHTAFRAPGLVEIYAAGQHFLGNDFVPNPALRPEKAANLELGFSLEAPGVSPDHGLSFSGSIFRNRVRDFIELSVVTETQVPAFQCLAPMPPVGCVNRSEDGTLNPAAPPIFVGGSTTSTNLERATLLGGELEASYRLGPIQFRAAYSQVRGEEDGSGQPLLNMPADRLRSAVDLRLPAGLNLTLSHLHAFAQNRVPTAADADGNPVDAIPRTPAYDVLDLMLAWEPPGEQGRVLGLVAPRLVLGADNLSNTAYRDHLNVLPSPGRNLRASISFGF